MRWTRIRCRSGITDRYPKEKALAHVLPILVGYLRERGQRFPTLTMIAAWLDPKSDNEWCLWLERRSGAPTSIQGYAKYHRWRLAIDQKAAKLRAASVTGSITQARSELANEEGVSEKRIEHEVRLARQGLVRKQRLPADQSGKRSRGYWMPEADELSKSVHRHLKMD